MFPFKIVYTKINCQKIKFQKLKESYYDNFFNFYPLIYCKITNKAITKSFV